MIVHTLKTLQVVYDNKLDNFEQIQKFKVGSAITITGELMGGSQREEDYDKLINRMNELGMETTGLDWYLNLRKYKRCYSIS